MEIPQDPIYRPFTIETGIAKNAEKPFGAGMSCRLFEAAEPASVQLGPRTHAVFAWQNKRLGLSHGKTCQAFGELFAISISRSTPARMCHRTGKRCVAAHEKLKEAICNSSQVVPGETGWRVGGVKAWLHEFAGLDEVVYVIDPT